MIPLPRETLLAAPFCMRPEFHLHPLQTGLGGSPWHVALASMLMRRTRRNVDVIAEVFLRWPTPEELAASDDELTMTIAPLGLHWTRARHMQQMSRRWNTPTWNDLRDLPGVGAYVADAVGLFCFGCTDLDGTDHVLEEYARARRT